MIDLFPMLLTLKNTSPYNWTCNLIDLFTCSKSHHSCHMKPQNWLHISNCNISNWINWLFVVSYYRINWLHITHYNTVLHYTNVVPGWFWGLQASESMGGLTCSQLTCHYISVWCHIYDSLGTGWYLEKLRSSYELLNFSKYQPVLRESEGFGGHGVL